MGAQGTAGDVGRSRAPWSGRHAARVPMRCGDHHGGGLDVGEFKAFLTKTNALALAIGIILGVALGTVVKSLVDDIIMPPIGLLFGGVDFASLQIVLKEASGDPAGGGDPLRRVHQHRDHVHRRRDSWSS